MENRAAIVAYDGASFTGFQSQKSGRSVQDALENALKIILRQDVTIHGSGRTDSGVHATGQVVSFSAENIPDAYRLLRGVNALLPASVAVHNVFAVPEWFHPRFSCIAREYEYLIWNHPTPSVFWKGRALWARNLLPVQELHDELQSLIGEHDFAAFTKAVYREENTNRYVDLISLDYVTSPGFEDGNLVSFKIRGNAFLHNMIRVITGSMLDRARGKLKINLRKILDSRDRNKAGNTAPPEGLYFRRAYYPEPLQYVDGLSILENYPIFAPRAVGPGK